MGIFVDDREDLRLIIKGLQHRGKIVVMTNGAFDLLHVGHIRSLKDARSRGDFLLVVLNSDSSVRVNKGKGLPINSLEERAEVLCELQCVDYVTVMEETTADNILEFLRPNIHAKGTDYTVDNLPEKATVLEYGGEVAIVGDPKDHSTTRIIKKIVSIHQKNSGKAASKKIAKTSVTATKVKKAGPKKVIAKKVVVTKSTKKKAKKVTKVKKTIKTTISKKTNSASSQKKTKSKTQKKVSHKPEGKVTSTRSAKKKKSKRSTRGKELGAS